MTSVVLPEPVAPTTATTSPAGTVRSMSVRTGALAALVGERHPLEADVAADVVEGERAGPVLDGGHGVEHLVDAHGGALGLAGQRHDPGQDLEREREHQHVGHERHQAAEASGRRSRPPARRRAARCVRVRFGMRAEHPHEAGVEA